MTAIKGGEFLIRQTKPEEIFIPEEWSEEEKMIAPDMPRIYCARSVSNG